jgi:hypothetical protein
MSRQITWQEKMISEGKCCTCGQPRNHCSRHCDGCARKRRDRSREKNRRKPDFVKHLNSARPRKDGTKLEE